MIQFSINPTHSEFKLVEKSSSYDLEKNKAVIKNVFHNPHIHLKEALGKLENFIECFDGKYISQTNLNDLLSENMISLFSECVCECCPLNRIRFPYLRTIFELMYFNRYVLKYINDDTITYTSFGAGYYFQDIVNLSLLIRAGYNHFNVIFVDNMMDYMDCLSNPKINQYAQNNQAKFEMNDIENPKRGRWCSFRTYRIIKILEIFENYFDHITIIETPEKYIELCRQNPNFKSNVLVGIDYVDETTMCSQPIFNLMALYCTRMNGLVFNFYKNEEFTLKANIYEKTKEFYDIPEIIKEYNEKRKDSSIKIKNTTDKLTIDKEDIIEFLELNDKNEHTEDQCIKIKTTTDKLTIDKEDITEFVGLNEKNEHIENLYANTKQNDKIPVIDVSSDGKLIIVKDDFHILETPAQISKLYMELFTKSIQMVNEQHVLFESDGAYQFIMRSGLGVCKKIWSRIKYPIYVFGGLCMAGYLIMRSSY